MYYLIIFCFWCETVCLPACLPAMDAFLCVMVVVCLGVCGESLTRVGMATQGLECFHAEQLWSKYKGPWPTFRKELVCVCVCRERDENTHTHVPQLLFLPYVFCIAKWLYNSKIVHPARCSCAVDIGIFLIALST